MRFVTYRGIDQLPADADRLFALAERHSMFLARPWFENLAATALQDGQALSLACVIDGDTVLAILPLMKPAGGVFHALKHRYSSRYSVLLGPNHQPATLACLARGLRASHFDSLLLEPVADTDNAMAGLQTNLQAVGFVCRRHFRFYNWILEVADQSFDDYMASRPARLRNTIARKRRKLEREQAYRIRLFVGRDAPPAMADYYRVYGASWKASEQYTALLDGLVAAFSKRGWSRLAVLYIGERPAAAQLWFVLHPKAYIFRLAYDETWQRYSPGSLLTAYLMEQVIDTDQVEEIDFLTGNEAYKQDWMSDRSERWALSCQQARKPERRFASWLGAIKKATQHR